MTVWPEGSRSATAARIATVFPAPTSPVTMPIVLSATAQAMRAAASPQSRWRCSLEGGRSRPNGMRASPNWVTTASIISFSFFFWCGAAVDGGELLLGAAEVTGQGGGGRAGAGEEQPGAADGGARVGAVVAAEPPGLQGGREPPADLGQELGQRRPRRATARR